MEDVNRDIFESFCTEKYVSNKTTNKSVTRVFVNNVFNLLDGKVQDVVGFCNDSSAKLAKLKHKVQQKDYGSMSIPGEDGVHTRVLTVPKRIRNLKISGATSAHTSGRLIVVPIEDFHPTLKALHQATGHGKERVMLHKVADQYEGLPKSAVQKYISMCSTCSRNKAQVLQAPPRVIISQGLFSCCQVDLVDMMRKPSGGYKYKLHLMDHFSKFHLLAPLVQKTQAEVNLALSHMFSIIGIPAILHTDNGSEFGALDRLLQQWPGSSDIVHGRPHHPQSQGLVERGNRVLEEKIAAMEATYHGDGPAPWYLWLPLVQYQLNTIVSRVIQMTPYECVFGKKPPSPPPLGWPARVVAEEEVDVEESQEDSQECDPLFDHSYSGVMEGIMDWNDAVAWVSRSTTANISDDATMMQQPRHLVKSAIEKELFALSKAQTLPRFSSRLWLGYSGKRSPLETIMKTLIPKKYLALVKISSCLVYRLSHLVPDIPFTPKEKDAMDMCICESLGVCNDDDSMGWVACIVYCRWVHCACIDRHSFKHYQEKEFTCGCNKIRPFQLKQFPVFNNTSLINVFLKKQRSHLKNVVVRTCSKTSKVVENQKFGQHVLTYCPETDPLLWPEYSE